MATLHLLAVMLPKDIIEFLLRDEAIAIWVYLSEVERDLSKPIISIDHINHLSLGQRGALLYLLAIGAVSVEVADVAAQVHLQLLLGLF